MGAYIALHHGNESVFLCSVLLIAIDLVYIATVLPESLWAAEDDERGTELVGEVKHVGGRRGSGRQRGPNSTGGGRRTATPTYNDDFLAFQVSVVWLSCIT